MSQAENEGHLNLCEYRDFLSIQKISNNDNKTPTASSVEQVRKINII